MEILRLDIIDNESCTKAKNLIFSYLFPLPSQIFPMPGIKQKSSPPLSPSSAARVRSRRLIFFLTTVPRPPRPLLLARLLCARLRGRVAPLVKAWPVMPQSVMRGTSAGTAAQLTIVTRTRHL